MGKILNLELLLRLYHVCVNVALVALPSVNLFLLLAGYSVVDLTTRVNDEGLAA